MRPGVVLSVLGFALGSLVFPCPSGAGEPGGARTLYATLDQRLAERAEESSLAAELRRLPAAARIGWLRRTLEGGGSSVLVLPLLAELEAQADAAAVRGDVALRDALLDDAARYALYGYVAMRTNAPLCRDGTSPDDYLYRLGQHIAPLRAHLDALEHEARAQLAATVLALDEAIRPVTRSDGLLCRRGRYGNRFCPPGSPKGTCPENAAPWAEFAESDDILVDRLKARRRARDEVRALGR